MNALSVYFRQTVNLEINRAKTKHPSATDVTTNIDFNTIISLS